MVRRLLLAAVLWSMVGAASHADSPLLLQRPTVNATEIVFVHGGDLWSVPRDGGAARRLTAGPGVETNPMFSPDGSTIAFTGEYDGNVDVYTMPAAGGVPKRLTWHPANDIALAWKPDGTRILFASSRESYVNVQQFYTVDLEGHFPEKLPLPMGAEASFSADATRLAYVPIGRAFTVWKQYRGGRTTPIWVATLANSRIDKVPRENSNDFSPMWVGDRVYFLSDREGAVTLFSYDTRSRRVRREITNRGLDIKSASAGPGAIVYEQFGSLRLFDVATGRDRSVPVTVNGDFPEVREKRVNVGRRLVNAHISPTGVRALFEARGEILSVPADKGDVRNFTNSTSVNERDPAWSPDGRTIAYFSDESGEYALHLAPQNGIGAVTKIAMPAPAFYYAPTWSPDSKKVAFLDSRLNIWYVDVESKKTVQVDRERYWAPGRQRQPAWSPDSKWLTYAKRLRNYLYAVHVYSLEGAKATQVTDGMSDARHVAFDKDGKYLYFSASTDIGPSLQPDVSSGALPSNRSVYLIVLDKRESSPFSPESDEEKPAEERPAGAPADTAKPPADTTKPQPPAEATAADGAKPPAPAASRAVNVVIDFDNISQRILAMPFPARNYSGLQVGRAGMLYAIESAQGGALTVHRYDVKSRRTDIAVTGVNFFEVAWNGDKMLTRQGDNWFIRNVPPAPPAGAAPAAPPPPAANATPLQTAAIEVRTVPRDEWRQMFREAWRIERDFFYDPNLHGLDAKTAEKTYEPYLASVASRGDLNYLFAEMLGNIVVSHLGVGGGELPEVRRVQTGLLGADFSIENGRYRFARVYNGENWNPDARAPLTQPGVNVVAGEYLLQVNGRDLTANDNVFSFFEATAGKNTLLRVGSDPSGTGARDVTVVPIPSDARLRNLAWIEGNRRKVDEATGGRVAYIYMPDTAFGGLTSFNRYFYAQLGKEAAIIDERFNGGGQLATDIIEQLARKPMSRVATRDGEDEEQPQGAIYGPKVMIINEYAGSGGDAMPNYFRRAGVGKLIGMRTWGGLVGRAGAPALMDGGIVSAPSSAVWDPATSQWDAENVGIAPDIEVEHDPELVRKGRDPQLERAIEEILAELKKSPQPRPKRPAYPNYHPKSASSTAAPAGRQ